MLLISATVSSLQAGERSRPSGDTSRGRIGASAPAPQHPDPAVEQYWSDRCVREREFGYTSSANCRHPAYNGSGYGYGYGPGYGYGYGSGDGYGYGYGYGGDRGTVVINRGGTVVIQRPGPPPQHRPDRDDGPPRRGSIGGWGR